MADTWAGTIKDWATGAVVSESDLDQEIRDRWTVFLAAMDGDTSSTTVKHRHKTGTLANRPTPGEAGRIYIPTDLNVLLTDDGSQWLIGPPLGPDCEAFDDDFVATSVDDGGGDKFGVWASTLGGSGAIVANPGSAARSQVELRTGATSSSGAKILSKNNNGFQVMQNTFLLVMTLKVSASAANGAYSFGFVDTFPGYPGDHVNGVYIYKLGTANVFAKIANASSRSTLDLSWDGTSWKTVIFEHDSGTPNVKVYLDTFNAGGLIGTLSGANMPATDAQLILGGQAQNNTTSDFRLLMDDVRLRRVR